MGEVLALVSALCFGITDFVNGLLSRRAHSAAVAIVAQLGGTGLILAAAPWAAAPDVSLTALAWGALSGVGTGLGLAFLYRGMSAGRFSVVVPLSVVTALALPVLVGVVLLGDRPGTLTWCGIIAALPALWLVSRSGRVDPGSNGAIAVGARDGLIAGTGFALQFIALAPVDPAAGLWPLVASRAASVLTILPLILTRPDRLRIPPQITWAAMGTGALGTTAIVLFTLAIRQQVLSIVIVLTALYPAIPVLLGGTVLRERLTRSQVAGLICAGAAIGLISLQ